MASVVLCYCWLFLLMSTSLLGIYRTNFLGAMSVISYSPHRLWALCPSRVHCKQLHHEYCPSVRSAGCHRPYVSCCRGSRAGRLHRLITSSGLDQSCDEPTAQHQQQQQPDHSEESPSSPSSTLLRLREYSTQSPLPSL